MTNDAAPGGEAPLDIYARLLNDRVVVLGAAIDDALASRITAELLYLESEDPVKEVTLHINSPGGSPMSFFTIYDTVQHLQPEVATICIGQAAAAAAVLLAAGAPGKRFALPHARILLHQPDAELGGEVADIESHAREITRQRNLVNEILSRHTGQPLEKVSEDTDRDFFLTPYEAREYGIVDEVITDRPWRP
jgi:ATP-dependent Clp protease, protease subunit